MGSKQFEQELLNGLPSPAYLFYSSDGFLLYEALSAIKGKYQSDAFNFDVFDAQSPDYIRPVEQIVDVLNTLPFMSEKRIVVIENIQKTPKKDIQRLQGYLMNPSPFSTLIMSFEGTSPRLFEAKNLKTIELNVQEREIPLWIKDKAKTKGIEFTDRAIEHLISFVGTDLGMLYSEIEKFSFLKTGKIEVEDINEMVYAGAEYNAFDIVNALKKGDASEVFRIFENLRKNTELQMLLGALNWQFAKLQGSAPEGRQTHFRNIFRLLHEADVSIKSSRPYAMEDLLVKLLKSK